MSWLRPSKRRGAKLRLFCFPFAGGGASTYHGWESALPPTVEVRPVLLPGRESRFSEPLIDDLDRLLDAMHPALAAARELPYAFFGHSMGALIAFELARRFLREGGPGPEHLFVSGCRAPHLPDPEPHLHDLSDPELAAELRRLGGTPPELLDDPELLELTAARMRADSRLTETRIHQPGPPLLCPVTVFSGTDDPIVSREQAEPWRMYTRSRFTLHLLEGDHFFLNKNEGVFLPLLAGELGVALRSHG